MDFSKIKKTRIALKFSYIGKNYDGLVIQINTENTVEEKLFKALKTCCLIDPEQDGIKSTIYTRCGRTDKGVSALANVCSLNVRFLPDGEYCQKINACLPPDIRVLAYADIPPQFDARFSCVFREYKYFFFKQDMDIDLIKEACKQYVGLHDFQNFCKKDHSFAKQDHQVVEYDEDEMYFRRIYSFRIEKVSSN